MTLIEIYLDQVVFLFDYPLLRDTLLEKYPFGAQKNCPL